MVDQNGQPTDIVKAPAITDEIQAGILQTPGQPDVSFSSVVAGYLSKMTDAAYIVIDPVTRKIVGATDTDAVVAATTEGTKKVQTFGPVDGQTGRSLKWEQKARESGFDADLGEALQAVVDAPTERPNYRVESLVQALLRAIPEEFENVDEMPMIVVDQSAGTVKVIWWSDARGEAQGALDNFDVETATNGFQVVLEDTEESGGAAPLIFEGGET